MNTSLYALLWLPATEGLDISCRDYKERLADKEFSEGRRITTIEVAEATGINRMTLSKMANRRGYSTVTDNIDKLCAYFGCAVEDLMEYIPEPDVDSKPKPTPKRSKGTAAEGQKDQSSKT